MSFSKNEFAIVGYGLTKQGRVPGKTPGELKAEGLALAIKDAGLKPKDIGGYIYQPGMIDMMGGGFSAGDVPRRLGIHPNLIWQVQTGGVSAIACLMSACTVVSAGIADYVGIGYGDAALSGSVLVGGSDMMGAGRSTPGSFGFYAPGPDHALATTRHMAMYGTTKEQLGAIALNQRANAQLRPDAYMHGRPMTMEDYLSARVISYPLNKFDYCLVADGGCGFIITTAERAKDHDNPIYISGVGLGHAVLNGYSQGQYLELGIKPAKENAFRMAGMELNDIDVAEIYDCFTPTVLLSLEDYGFCAKGEGGPYAESGKLSVGGGGIPVNTGGGELSWSYMQGYTPLSEGLIQMRGHGGATQVPDAKTCLVTGHGGTGLGSMEYAEGSLILTRR